MLRPPTSLNRNFRFLSDFAGPEVHLRDPMDTPQDLIADPSNAGQVGVWDGKEGAF